MHAGEDRVDDVAANVLDAQHDHGGIGGEQTNDGACGQFHDDGDGDAICNGDRRGVFERSYRTFRFACADVLCGYRRNGGKHGGWYEEQHADYLFDHADGRGIVETTIIGDDGDDDERDLDAAVPHRGRHADFENAAKHIAPRTQIRRMQAYACSLVPDGGERHDHADGLRECGAERGTGRSKPEIAHEQIVKCDVADAGHRNEVLGLFESPRPRKIELMML